MMIRVFGLNKCDTCRKARAWLDEHGVAYDFIDYRDNPVPASTLAQWASAVGGWDKLVNRASLTWRGLPPERKSPESPAQWLALIAEHPTLVRRPVLTRLGEDPITGFSDKKYAEIFK
ncbi:MAG TPA: Spx/MgsR family RNA polymerase-binding regulatory protein [Burkholderiaceae bacterium]|nr:Spx/MgsR family RNA polymerase-binding regulatory protein [Burkholderiaceae bacterium]